MKFPIEIPGIHNDALTTQVNDRWNSLTKPPGSLGTLENIVTRLALMAGTPEPTAQRKIMAIFCADHGITTEGVSAYPREVTVQMVRNFLAGGAAINVLCRQFGITPLIVDAGIDGDPIPGAIPLSIARGTASFTTGPAMTEAQLTQALTNGVELARQQRPHCDIAAVGEMGIGNTTSASALLCAFTGLAPTVAVGPGTGLDRAGITRKSTVIHRAMAFHQATLRNADPCTILATFGGFEIATMTGFLLGAASLRLPVVIDGFIASAAALAAHRINPRVLDYLLFSHLSAEAPHASMLSALAVQPILNLGMRLGEGSGSAIAMPIIDAALALYNQMATFTSANVTEAQ